MKLYMGDCCIPLVKNGDLQAAMEQKGEQDEKSGKVEKGYRDFDVTYIFSRRRKGVRRSKETKVAESKCRECGGTRDLIDISTRGEEKYLCAECYTLLMNFGKNSKSWRNPWEKDVEERKAMNCL